MDNSQIKFDITDSITFDFTRIIALIVILLSAIFYFLANHVLARWISLMRATGGLFLLFHILLLATFIKYQPDQFPVFILQFSWFWIMYLADLSLQFKAVKKVALEYVLSIGALLALVFAFTAYQYFEKNELESKKRFSNKLILEKDVLGEYYLNEIIEKFREDQFISERIQRGIFARQNIREKVRRQFVSSYFDKYDLEVFLFDQDSVQLDVAGDSYGDFLRRYAKSEFETDYDEIYLVDDSENIALKKYACLLPIQSAGFLAIELNRKKNVSTSVFPELLVESRYEQEASNTFDYTIFRDSTVLYGQGKFGHVNYLDVSDLQNEKLYEEGISIDERHFYGKTTEDGRTIVITSMSYPNRNWVVNFSFIFLLFIILISAVGLFYRLVLNYQTLSLANKIQLYLALGFLIPLFITGFTLLNTLNESYKDEITRSYLKKSLRISENLVDETVQFTSNASNLNAFANYVGDVSRFVQADLNIYTADGILITTSQPGVFGLGLLSDHINPIALQALTTDNQNIIVDESIGLLDFKTTYTVISGYSDGQLYGIVALPFFDSKNHLRRQQKEVFANLLMIFALIFLFALISGNYLLNYLIGPLTLVSQHIKRTTLEDNNMPIDYSSDDEIGVLVKEYNQMLIKLERNKEALARSQKESAWKEIARQVAHEIKNPLTPMRLKIQQLQRDLTDERQIKLLDSMITQIDTLSDIADSFSEFAKMPAPENIEFDVVNVVSESVRLHRSKQVSIQANLPSDEIIIWADPNILGRIMNNLLLNGIQAVKEGKIELSVDVILEDNKVEIRCKDNGSGIPEDIKTKIFTTYFSTKITGSGIGLAVAKKGIENAGGNIWFESKEGEGSTFYISLPVYEAL
ncbi:MAG: HAMP domain-containing histidine kinase [Cytophagales bacterium]|nr:HAMP domain-containing histidine kinase [Cytophagales bacterium]